LKILTSFDLQLDNSEILLLLSSNKTSKVKKEPPKSLIDAIERLKIKAQTLFTPKAMYDFFESSNLNPKFLFKQSQETILAVCTIGEELEKECRELIDNNSLFESVILDAIASHAVEVLAEKFNQLLIYEIKENYQDYQFTARFSPGYCKWTIDQGQKMIFEKLPANKICVKLSESFMMIPRKSISFAINIGPKIDTLLGKRECETCDEINCAHRR
jgi:cobalamin-dependent methionine synthase I